MNQRSVNNVTDNAIQLLTSVAFSYYNKAKNDYKRTAKKIKRIYGALIVEFNQAVTNVLFPKNNLSPIYPNVIEAKDLEQDVFKTCRMPNGNFAQNLNAEQCQRAGGQMVQRAVDPYYQAELTVPPTVRTGAFEPEGYNIKNVILEAGLNLELLKRFYYILISNLWILSRVISFQKQSGNKDAFIFKNSDRKEEVLFIFLDELVGIVPQTRLSKSSKYREDMFFLKDLMKVTPSQRFSFFSEFEDLVLDTSAPLNVQFAKLWRYMNLFHKYFPNITKLVINYFPQNKEECSINCGALVLEPNTEFTTNTPSLLDFKVDYEVKKVYQGGTSGVSGDTAYNGNINRLKEYTSMVKSVRGSDTVIDISPLLNREGIQVIDTGACHIERYMYEKRKATWGEGYQDPLTQQLLLDENRRYIDYSTIRTPGEYLTSVPQDQISQEQIQRRQISQRQTSNNGIIVLIIGAIIILFWKDIEKFFDKTLKRKTQKLISV